MNYSDTILAIKEECSKINLTYSKEGDGRMDSAMKEDAYLSLLEKGLKERHSSIKFEKQPVERWWWDFKVNEIPFNLKLTTGKTGDNAFNKVATIYSITGKEVEKKSMNFNQFFKILQETPKKTERDRMTEYHYLVVNKNNGKILLKSILDIHSYKSNPCNIMQINWSSEFDHIDFVTPDTNFKQKIQELMKTIQFSIKQSISNIDCFANADIETEFPK